MLYRKHFLTSCAAGATALGMPADLRAAASAYTIDGEDVCPGMGFVRSVTLKATRKRDAVQFIFASLRSDAVKATIVAGSQLAIRGLQLWQIADKCNATVAVNGGFFLTDSFAYDGLLVTARP
ncbi:MAG: hypothetical protein ACXVAM_18975 [Vulcanimicrobiaceae bacterium]